MPSQFLLEKANRVLDHVSPEQDGTKQIDPFTIISLILGLVQLFKQCKNNPTEVARNPGMFQRMQVKRYVRNSMGREAFQRKGHEILNGIFALGQDATPEDIQQLMREAYENE